MFTVGRLLSLCKFKKKKIYITTCYGFKKKKKKDRSKERFFFNYHATFAYNKRHSMKRRGRKEFTMDSGGGEVRSAWNRERGGGGEEGALCISLSTLGVPIFYMLQSVWLFIFWDTEVTHEMAGCVQTCV